MTFPLALTVKHEGRSIQLRLTRCKIFMAGEFAGNVELYIDCDRSQEPFVQESLHLQVPGEDTSVNLVATGGPEDGVMLGFHCEAIERLPSIPESLTFLWCGEPIASVAPELAESVPIDTVHDLVDPLEILGQPSMQTSNLFRLGIERSWFLLVPSLMIGAFGAAACFADFGLPTSGLPTLRIAGGALLFVAGAIGWIGVGFPSRQVWFDRDRRQILILEGRTRSVEKSLVDAERASIDGYAHVRLCEREYAPGPGDDSDTTRTEYFVRLEGPVPFAFDDGRVHSRSDALHLAIFSSEIPARRFAAEVGYQVGLRILIATDW